MGKYKYFIKIISDELIIPYTITKLRKDNPASAIPDEPTDEYLKTQNIYRVYDSSIPKHNSITQKSVLLKTPKLIKGKWKTVYDIIDLSEEDIEININKIKENKRQEIRDSVKKAYDTPILFDGVIWNGGINTFTMLQAMSQLNFDNHVLLYDVYNKPHKCTVEFIKALAIYIYEIYQEKYQNKQNKMQQIEDVELKDGRSLIKLNNIRY